MVLAKVHMAKPPTQAENRSTVVNPSRDRKYRCPRPWRRIPSLPFQLAECGDGVAGIEFVEHFPSRPLTLAGGGRRLGYWRSLGNQAAYILGEAFEISSLGFDRSSEILHDRTMSRDDAPGGNA